MKAMQKPMKMKIIQIILLIQSKSVSVCMRD